MKKTRGDMLIIGRMCKGLFFAIESWKDGVIEVGMLVREGRVLGLSGEEVRKSNLLQSRDIVYGGKRGRYISRDVGDWILVITIIPS